MDAPALVRGVDATVGIVIIARNEGERLRRCLESGRGFADLTAYVDSGSTDDSVALGRALADVVVELDMRLPFTAARARNEGFERLIQTSPTLNYVFFVDGDCEIDSGWVAAATRFLNEHTDVAVVCGRRRERFPEQSPYNLLCDIEWDTPIGETKACGGDAVMRVTAFQQVQGFRADLICGEEPELCVRLRQAGWRIWRLDEEMTLHDAALQHFSQWWTRARRAGYAYAQGVALHGRPPERHWVGQSRRAWLYGLILPLITLVLTVSFGGWGLLLLLAYPVQLARIGLRGSRPARERWCYAAAMVISKFPEMLGQLNFLVDSQRHRQSRLIEYK